MTRSDLYSSQFAGQDSNLGQWQGLVLQSQGCIVASAPDAGGYSSLARRPQWNTTRCREPRLATVCLVNSFMTYLAQACFRRMLSMRLIIQYLHIARRDAADSTDVQRVSPSSLAPCCSTSQSIPTFYRPSISNQSTRNLGLNPGTSIDSLCNLQRCFEYVHCFTHRPLANCTPA